MQVKYQLKNGLKVILVESKKSPVVTMQVWVRTGSADESKGLEGISHFIEHLVFKGTDRFGVGEVAKAIEGSGGVLNAYTTFDQTVFYCTLSNAYYETGLEALSQMMGHPLFDKNEIDNEREVVIEEIKRSLDNPRQMASRQLFSTLYKRHPYGIPIIGYEENIRKVTVEQIKKYFNDRYVPSNMTLFVVGDFDIKQMKGRIEKHFGNFKSRKLRRVKRKQEPAGGGVRVGAQSSKFAEGYLYLCWPAPKQSHRDSVALSVLSMIFGYGETSRLHRKLVLENHIANSAGCSVFSPLESGFFAISLALPAEKAKPGLEQTLAELNRFLVEGASQEELHRAIRHIESDRYYSLETVDGLANLYSHFEFFYGSYKKFEEVVRQTKKLTTNDLLRVFKKYLDPSKVRMTALIEGDVSNTEQMLRDWQKSWALAVKASTKKKSQAKKSKAVAKKKYAGINIRLRPGKQQHAPQEILLSNGVRFIGKRVEGSTVVSIRVAGLGGVRIEPEGKGGLNELMSRTWMSGAGDLSEAELHERIEDMTAGISAFAGRNTAGVSMSALEPMAEKVFELATQVLLSPKFDEHAISREKRLMIEQMRTRQDKPSQKCMLNLLQTIFPNHPYGRDPLGTESSMKSIGQKELQGHRQAHCTSGNMAVALVGDVDLKKWAKIVERGLVSLPKGSRNQADQPQGKIASVPHVFEEMKKEQSHIALAFRGIQFRDPRRYALDLLQSILSGQGGRLFIELRDKASLAYSVSPIRMDGVEQGYFGAYIGCSPEKSETAIQMMRKELQRLCDERVPADEIERSQRYLIGRHDISLQKTGFVADQLLFDELYQIGVGESEKYRERILQVTPEQIRDVAQALFQQTPVLSVVGARNVQI